MVVGKGPWPGPTEGCEAEAEDGPTIGGEAEAEDGPTRGGEAEADGDATFGGRNPTASVLVPITAEEASDPSCIGVPDTVTVPPGVSVWPPITN